eukprot:SAG31_NODE_2685_length_5256_cov_2.839442_1_plen_78_part_00
MHRHQPSAAAEFEMGKHKNKMLEKRPEPLPLIKPSANDFAATLIQSHSRGWIARRRWRRFINAGEIYFEIFSFLEKS